MIHNIIVFLSAVVIFPFRKNTYRWLFLKKTKVRVHLSSGSHVDILCIRWEGKMNEDGCEYYRFEGMYNTVTFSINNIIAFEER
jgi:hypothetical protein